MKRIGNKNDFTYESVEILKFKNGMNSIQNKHPLLTVTTDSFIRIMLAVIEILKEQGIRD